MGLRRHTDNMARLLANHRKAGDSHIQPLRYQRYSPIYAPGGSLNDRSLLCGSPDREHIPVTDVQNRHRRHNLSGKCVALRFGDFTRINPLHIQEVILSRIKAFVRRRAHLSPGERD